MSTVYLPPLEVKEIHTLARLASNDDFQTFVFYLRRCLSDSDVAARRLMGDELVRSQGRGLTLEALIELADTAPAVSNKVRTNQS